MIRWLRSILEWIKNLFAKKTMRRKISLYIADKLVDLDDQSFILFNYTMDDLSNPTIVKNSFTQQITLKGTPNNNRIFGDSFRVDRRIANQGGNSGIDYNASQKTPFAIYNEMGEILESGYVKLDSISRNKADVQYKVTLYGGLGSFLYSLSYDENGNKRTLADLDYMGNGDPGELDFTITKETLEQAWEDLADLYAGAEPTPTGVFSIINFAPAYNGYPDNFSPDKGILSLPGAGLPASVGDYSDKSGYGLVNLANPQDEWAVKDIRSYLQRPVLWMKKFWDAICRPENNGGYEVDISQFAGGDVPCYDVWLTLPTIPSLGSNKQSEEGLSITSSSTASSGNTLGQFNVVGDVPYGAVVNALLRCKLRFNMPSGANSYNTLSLDGLSSNSRHWQHSIIFLQVVAYSSDDTMVGGSPVKVLTPFMRGGRGDATSCNFTPPFHTDNYDSVNTRSLTKISSGVFEFDDELSFAIEAQNASYYVLKAYVYTCDSYLGRGVWQNVYSGNGATSRATLYHDLATNFQADSSFFVDGSGNSVTKTDPSELRSGARVTKQMLLSTSATPADYLLSLCKMFGLYFVTNEAEKKITILKRNDLYQDETIDLTRRVDLSKGITIQPLVFNAKWYDFILEDVGGAFCEEYQNIEGISYGIQRVDTGFDFNADSVNLMDSVVYRNACTILQRSRYWNIIEQPSNIVVETPVDLTQYSVFHFYISLDGVWKSSANTDAILIPVNPGEKYKFHTGSATGYVGVMQTNSHTNNSNASFSTSYPQIFQPTDGQEITIPSDGHYLYMVLKNSVIGTGDTTLGLLTTISSVFLPSPFLDKGNTITRWNADDETLDTQISCPPATASVTYYNPYYNGYDIQNENKLQFADSNGKMVDGKDVLVFLNGFDMYAHFKITDDLPIMSVVNDGKPCWILDDGEGVLLPIFSRYRYQWRWDNYVMIQSLDFGAPRQLDIPGIVYDPSVTIYAKAWRQYLSDRYDVNTKVMTCRVDFSGMMVNQELLRKFYWYDNTLWVLNKIKNYSLTTFDPVECEFVQVQDKSNYLNGQSF